MSLKVDLYGYAVGAGSSRKPEKATYEEGAISGLATDQHPHFTTSARIRRPCLPPWDDFFHQVLELWGCATCEARPSGVDWGQNQRLRLEVLVKAAWADRRGGYVLRA